MSLTSIGVALALVTGVLGAWLYIDQSQSVSTQADAVRAQVLCQQAQQSARQAALMSLPASAVAQADSAAEAACKSYAQAQAAERAQQAQQAGTLDKIKHLLLDTGGAR